MSPWVERDLDRGDQEPTGGEQGRDSVGRVGPLERLVYRICSVCGGPWLLGGHSAEHGQPGTRTRPHEAGEEAGEICH